MKTKANPEALVLPQVYADALDAMRALVPICEKQLTPSQSTIDAADRAYLDVGMLLTILRRSLRYGRVPGRGSMAGARRRARTPHGRAEGVA